MLIDNPIVEIISITSSPNCSNKVKIGLYEMNINPLIFSIFHERGLTSEVEFILGNVSFLGI